jgi:hypothetical protein
MHRTVPILIALLAVSAVGAAPPQWPELPAAPHDLVYARPFELAAGIPYPGDATGAPVTRGWILIIDAHPALAYPRQAAEPVLYAGDRAAWFARPGYPTGRYVALVPGDLDLLTQPVWFGTPELPERIDDAVVARERALADAARIGPFPEHVVRTALDTGGNVLALSDGLALEAFARELYETYVVPLGPVDPRNPAASEAPLSD